jgi:NitT/TauT family transport system substrate-binding protein
MSSGLARAAVTPTSKNGRPPRVCVICVGSWDFYGNAVIASGDFIKEHPEAVEALIRATLRGWKDIIADPEGAIEIVAKYDPLIDKALELERLQLALKVNVLTPYVKEHGIGDVDEARLKNAIAQLALAYVLDKTPEPYAVRTSEFLPAAEERMLPH